jgi:8-oxo-dGTP pyrophosphatase MutT (NUDIX family)
LILVKLRYAPGWRVPGGGRPSTESPVDAALRELREEIGMIAHGEVEPAPLSAGAARESRGTVSLVIVRNVRFRPRWSWEVEQVCEADLDALPDGVSDQTRRWLVEVRRLL